MPIIAQEFAHEYEIKEKYNHLWLYLSSYFFWNGKLETKDAIERNRIFKLYN